MNTAQKEVKFSKGEVNERLLERQDLDLLNASASYIKNLYSTPYGSIKLRPGTENLATISTPYPAKDYTVTSLVDDSGSIDAETIQDLTNATAVIFDDGGTRVLVAVGTNINAYTTDTAYDFDNLTQIGSSFDISSYLSSVSQMLVKRSVIVNGVYQDIVYFLGIDASTSDSSVYYFDLTLTDSNFTVSTVSPLQGSFEHDSATITDFAISSSGDRFIISEYDSGEAYYTTYQIESLWLIDTVDADNELEYVELQTAQGYAKFFDDGDSLWTGDYFYHLPNKYVLANNEQRETMSGASVDNLCQVIDDTYVTAIAEAGGAETDRIVVLTITRQNQDIWNILSVDRGSYVSENNFGSSGNQGQFYVTDRTGAKETDTVEIRDIYIDAGASGGVGIEIVADGTDTLWTGDLTGEPQNIKATYTKQAYETIAINYPDWVAVGEIAGKLNLSLFVFYDSTDTVLKSKIMPFIFNTEQKYVVHATTTGFGVYDDDGNWLSFLSLTIDEDYIEDLKYTQQEDTMIITHPEIPPQVIQRTFDAGVVGWVLYELDIQNYPYYNFGGEVITNPTTTLTPSAVEGNVKLTAGGGTIFTAGSVGQIIDGGGGRVRITEYVSATVVQGYTIIPFYATTAIASGEWDFIKGHEPVWSSTRGYPATCMFYQQRLWFGGSKSRPRTIWASRVGQYNDFENAGNYDNDAIDITLSSSSVDQIVNIFPNRGVQIFTKGAEWTLPEGTLTPDSIIAVKNTSNGSLTGLNPVDLSGYTLFVEKNGKNLLSYVYNDSQGAYVTTALSLLTDMISNPVGMTVDYNSNRDEGNYLYLVNSDGNAVVACLLLEEKINSFTRFETDNGNIKDVITLVSDVYLLVERNNNIYLEKIDGDLRTDFTQQFSASATITGLGEYEGNTVYVYNDDADYGSYTVSGGQITLTETPNNPVYIGYGIDYDLTSNRIAINSKTLNIEKRISKATMATKDTSKVTFTGQTKERDNDIYDFYGVTNPARDPRYTISGTFDYFEMLSLFININYGDK